MTSTKTIPDGATINLTITINDKAWKQLESQGYSDSDIEKKLREQIIHGITHNASGNLVYDVLDISVRKYY